MYPSISRLNEELKHLKLVVLRQVYKWRYRHVGELLSDTGPSLSKLTGKKQGWKLLFKKQNWPSSSFSLPPWLLPSAQSPQVNFSVELCYEHVRCCKRFLLEIPFARTSHPTLKSFPWSWKDFIFWAGWAEIIHPALKSVIKYSSFFIQNTSRVWIHMVGFQTESENPKKYIRVRNLLWNLQSFQA